MVRLRAPPPSTFSSDFEHDAEKHAQCLGIDHLHAFSSIQSNRIVI